MPPHPPSLPHAFDTDTYLPPPPSPPPIIHTISFCPPLGKNLKETLVVDKIGVDELGINPTEV